MGNKLPGLHAHLAATFLIDPSTKYNGRSSTLQRRCQVQRFICKTNNAKWRISWNIATSRFLLQQPMYPETVIDNPEMDASEIARHLDTDPSGARDSD